MTAIKGFLDDDISQQGCKLDGKLIYSPNEIRKLIIQKGKGYGSAIIEGFREAKNKFGCIYNADYSFDPRYLGDLTNLTKQ